MSTNFQCDAPFNKQNKEPFDLGVAICGSIHKQKKRTKAPSKYLCVGQCKQSSLPVTMYRRARVLPNRRRMSVQKFAFIVFSCSRRFCLFGISSISSFFSTYVFTCVWLCVLGVCVFLSCCILVEFVVSIPFQFPHPLEPASFRWLVVVIGSNPTMSAPRRSIVSSESKWQSSPSVCQSIVNCLLNVVVRPHTTPPPRIIFVVVLAVVVRFVVAATANWFCFNIEQQLTRPTRLTRTRTRPASRQRCLHCQWQMLCLLLPLPPSLYFSLSLCYSHSFSPFFPLTPCFSVSCFSSFLRGVLMENCALIDLLMLPGALSHVHAIPRHTLAGRHAPFVKQFVTRRADN